MYGAMVGDTIGSIYEWSNIKTKKFPLFWHNCFPTDDSYMTIAVGIACMRYVEECGRDLDAFRRQVIAEMHRLGSIYPHKGYGGGFKKWLLLESQEPYYSCGNGSAMRVSPCGWVCDTLEETLALAEASADVTHNHPEGIKGAKATAAAIFLARTGHSRAEIRAHIRENYYPLDKTLKEIRPVYVFDGTCQGTVPEAIEAFLESVSFEDAIRNAISLGGDSDTLAAITGSIAEAYYGVPKGIRDALQKFMDRDMRNYEIWDVERFYTTYVKGKERKNNDL